MIDNVSILAELDNPHRKEARKVVPKKGEPDKYEAPPQVGIIPQTPGAIPNRRPTMSELVELKLMCRDARYALEGVYGGIVTINLGEGFEGAAETFDEVGRLIDAITQYCQRSLKRLDEKKGGL